MAHFSEPLPTRSKIIEVLRGLGAERRQYNDLSARDPRTDVFSLLVGTINHDIKPESSGENLSQYQLAAAIGRKKKTKK